MTTEVSDEPPAAQRTLDKSDLSPTDRLDPWMEDGNIVLAAEGKYFRVHRSILGSYSEVFKGMFQSVAEPNEGGSSEFIDQCPVVHLHDSVTDVQIMLKAMYDRGYPIPFYEKVPLSIVSAFFRLGEKYDIEQFIDEAKARLCCTFDASLSVAAKISSSNPPQLFRGIADGDPYNFQVMNLLREMDLKAPLPLAMYQCILTRPLSSIVDGYKHNGSVHVLSRTNLESWILMKNILENFRVRPAQSLRVSTSCVVQSSCMLNVRRLWSDDVTVAQPFGPWRHEWDKLFCDACRSDLGTWRNAAIQKAWNQIPTAFGFDSWGEVAKSDDFPSLRY